MTGLSRDVVARLRIEREAGRLDDLSTLVDRVLDGTGDGRTTTLRDRVLRRRSSVESIAAEADVLATWQDEEQGSDALVGEVLAAVMTRLLRDHGLDDGTFSAAEALLDELAAAARIESLALGQTQEVESVDHARRTVALRFPGARIWDLPFLVHEFGHHAVRRVTHIEPLLDTHPLEEVTQAVADTLRHQQVEPDRQRPHADELMADSVATVAFGPMYPVACLCLRANGNDAGSRTHPSWRDRIATMRETLDELSEQTRQARHSHQRQSVVDPLATAVLGAPPEVTAAGALAARRTVQEVLAHCPDLLYADADLAIQVERRLRAHATTPPPGVSVRATLDGAWRWRLSDPYAAAAGSSLVAAWCSGAMSSAAERG